MERKNSKSLIFLLQLKNCTFRLNNYNRCHFSQNMNQTLLILVHLALSFSLLHSQPPSTPPTLRFPIEEESPPDTFIASISRHTLVAPHLPPHQKFKFLTLRNSTHSHYLHLDPNTGVLTSKKVIDRDLICPSFEDCLLDMQIALHPPSIFKVFNLEVKTQFFWKFLKLVL